MTSRRQFLGAAAGLPLLGPALRAGKAAAAERPVSHLLILADQLTWWVTDPLQRGVLELPNMDRMRAEGTTFESCYTTSPICAPARLCMRTGRYPHANPGANDLLADTPRIEQVLQARGFRTHYIGKWHLSPGAGLASGFVPPRWRPYWTSFIGHEVSHSDHVTFIGEDPTPVPTGAWDAGTLTDLAIARLRREAIERAPFFMQLNYLAPHPPYPDYPQSLAEYTPFQMVPRPNVPFSGVSEIYDYWHHYMNATRGVDLELGRLLDEIDALGIEVVVMFSSDHGDMLGCHGQTGKRSPYEESARIPLFVRGPGWQPGRVVPYPVAQIDFPRTITRQALAGQAGPGAHGRGLGSGVDLRERRDSVYLELAHGPFNAVWSKARWRALVTDDHWKLALSESGARVLFELAADPYELNDLAGQGLPKELELYDRMRTWAHDTGDDFFG